MSDLRTIAPPEFARRLRQLSSQTDNRFAFFLGAGCSISSGIPSAAELVIKHWLPALRDLQAPGREDLADFARELFPHFDTKNPALIYPQVVERLFLQPDEAQREIERLCTGAFPSPGYVALALLMSRHGGLFNVVVTTNFDDLAQDALHLFTSARPLVIGHEALAGFIRPTRTRPLIVKLHGDHRLAPHNASDELQQVERRIAEQTRTLLHDRGLIFLGYGGHDEGIRAFLESMPREALPLGVYWCADEDVPPPLREFLAARNAVHVRGRRGVSATDFDTIMLLLADAFDIDLPTKRNFDALYKRYHAAARALARRLGRGDPEIRSALRRL